ncbi:MAG TPA: hypothetical protein VJY41_03565 [Prolixibacteraceae bacterium]|nr:hypothetical protein [Prolixibacteraceae bacterium]
MKKLQQILVLVLVCAGMVMFNSCDKENELNNNSSINTSESISVIDGILSFESYEDYEEAMKLLLDFDNTQRDQWEKAMNFKSLRTVSIDGDPLLFVKEIGEEFATVLSPENEIIIAGNYIQLNFNDETATTRSINTDNCDISKNEATDEKVYSFYDDVNIFNEGIYLKSAKNKNCAYIGRDWQTWNVLNNGHVEWRLCYESYWLKYRLLAQIRPVGYNYITVRIMAEADDNIYYRFDDNQDYPIGTINDSSTSAITREIYNGTRRIWDFELKVTFAANSDSDDYKEMVRTRSCK